MKLVYAIRAQGVDSTIEVREKVLDAVELDEMESASSSSSSGRGAARSRCSGGSFGEAGGGLADGSVWRLERRAR
jgi:hypothetical protein